MARRSGLGKGLSSLIPPGEATPMAGVAIDWTHGGNTAAAREAAAKMVSTYAIRFPAALVSRHTQRRAVDMTIETRFFGVRHLRQRTAGHCGIEGPHVLVSTLSKIGASRSREPGAKAG